jgi:hypothetical protein
MDESHSSKHCPNTYPLSPHTQTHQKFFMDFSQCFPHIYSYPLFFFLDNPTSFMLYYIPLTASTSPPYYAVTCTPRSAWFAPTMQTLRLHRTWSARESAAGSVSIRRARLGSLARACVGVHTGRRVHGRVSACLCVARVHAPCRPCAKSWRVNSAQSRQCVSRQKSAKIAYNPYSVAVSGVRLKKFCIVSHRLGAERGKSRPATSIR